ncbi:MAG: hypothetical protein A2854_02630 [Parcubacteria group bacterium RIFCSPHIGHO2_01_FULL_56_18]|nr:MAG: hypothetical protein A2854_02630 [Parcubacteria group bacterium RIFCSPHIGHO2_01_FULL_56_18]
MKAAQKSPTSFAIKFDREKDGRWIAEVTRLPGVMAYGKTKNEALRKVSAIALRTLADTVEAGRRVPAVSRLFEHGMAGR